MNAGAIYYLLADILLGEVFNFSLLQLFNVQTGISIICISQLGD